MVFGNALIGLREGLEAALVVSILVAFLVKADRRGSLPWVWLGVLVAVALSAAFGWLITFTQHQMTFEQKEVFGGSMSLIAVAFVTGMIFWMRRAARTISTELRGKLGTALEVGPWAVAVMAFLAVGREGLETATLFYSAAQGSASGTSRPLIGFLVGIAVAVVLAFALYKGALRINLGRFFTITGALLIFVAAGVLAYGLHDLQEGGVLPGLHTLAFDLSGPMPEDSWYGALLKGVFNYSAQTTVLQAIAWIVYIAVVLPLFLRKRKAPVKKQEQPAVAATAQR
ncbi:iron uptake transporter permease EfeU [Labedaea rhizosphaerae]|uniref:High-affinity iron transporter n=1 Tax=Labedaea rhizosphaerae TaxID=598644 RepID=A0A4R6SIF4_LABRH|nr:iron uptake transporter permease EfeU [Labedaea rhizosphaerae]TDQ00659.1 high-affinity iron transporter [Labedaea rhizosphaerae]